jgi:enoyl-CoA hydratase/carnithine racemase
VKETMQALVTFAVTDGVGLLTLNRPERLNALDDAMHRALDAAWVDAYHSDARVIVVTGAGRAFTVGADMERLDRLAAGGDFDIPRPGALTAAFDGIDAPAALMTSYTFPLASPKPVIAAINGPCVGVGVLIAAACDIRFASPTAMFSASFPQRAVVAEFGLDWLLPRIVGRGIAADILLSGRRVEAEEAARIGLVSRVIEADFLDSVLAYAREMAATASPRSTRLIKQQLWDSATSDYVSASQRGWDLLKESFGTQDFAEGIASFREQRPPRFIGA